MNNMITLHDLSYDDCLELSILEKECFTTPWSITSFQNDCKNTDAKYVIIKFDNIIIGYVGYWKVIDEAMITNICIKKEYRNNGYAKVILEKIIETAKSQNLKIMTLEVRASNIPAISLYKKFGFYQVGLRKNYYTNPTEDAILMNLDL